MFDKNFGQNEKCELFRCSEGYMYTNSLLESFFFLLRGRVTKCRNLWISLENNKINVSQIYSRHQSPNLLFSETYFFFSSIIYFHSIFAGFGADTFYRYSFIHVYMLSVLQKALE